MSDEPFNPKPKKKRKPRETGRTGTEASGRKAVKALGGDSFKWRSPGRNGVPDQIELYGAEAMAAWLDENWSQVKNAAELEIHEDRLIPVCVELLAAAIRFTEYKAPGKLEDLTVNQKSMHRLLRDRGFTVDVVDIFRSKK